MDVYNLKQQIDSKIERYLGRVEEKVGTSLCLQHTTIDSQRDSQLDREEEEGTDRCLQHITIDREVV